MNVFINVLHAVDRSCVKSRERIFLSQRTERDPVLVLHIFAALQTEGELWNGLRIGVQVHFHILILISWNHLLGARDSRVTSLIQLHIFYVCVHV